MERDYPSAPQPTFRFSHLSMSMNWRNEMLLFLCQNGGILELFSLGSEIRVPTLSICLLQRFCALSSP
jgi:hypothetical protein